MYSVKKQSLLKKQKSRFSSESTQNLSWTFCRLIYHFNLIPRSRPTVEWKDYPLKTRVFDQSSNDFVLNVYCTFILREEFQKRNRSGSEIKQPTITNPMEQKGASFPTQSFIVKLRTLFHNLFITDIGFIRETRMKDVVTCMLRFLDQQSQSISIKPGVWSNHQRTQMESYMDETSTRVHTDLSTRNCRYNLWDLSPQNPFSIKLRNNDVSNNLEK